MTLTPYCATHDGYYREPRCGPACALLTTWREPDRGAQREREARRQEQRESGEACREAPGR